MNNWNISGEIIRHGIKGDKYPKLWIQVELASPKELNIQQNRLFINFDLDSNPNSKFGKVAENIKNKLQTDKFFFLSEAMICFIKKSTKGDNGEWISEDVIGTKGKINNLTLSSTRFDNINLGIASGKVINYMYSASSDFTKFVIEERYRLPNNNEWKSRSIPILYKGSFGKDLTGTYVFSNAMLCGNTPENESKVYGLAKKVILL